MPARARIFVAALFASAAGGCASTSPPYAVVGNPVNPAPAPGYQVLCQSGPSPTYVLTGDFVAHCDPAWAASRTAIRVRG